MNSILALGSSSPVRQVTAPESRAADATVYETPTSSEEENPVQAAFDSLQGGDPAAQHEKTLHLISHVNAECFISLLQITDPKPDDYRARAEYKRFYGHLRQSLETPVTRPTPYPDDSPPEILR
jgi:hypothetical protein